MATRSLMPLLAMNVLLSAAAADSR
jgi:hypothetical protein